jgi:drug/metabolite transporter (DMT)-like permease
MAVSVETRMHADERGSFALRVGLAYFAIYVLWGSTFLAIRTAVASIPPLLAAGVRFAIAGAILYGWALTSGVPQPSSREWRNVSVLGALMFLVAYAALFWAEKTLPSGVASVLVATIPLWTAVLEMFVLRRQPVRWLTLGGAATGLAGVTVLAFDPSGGQVHLLPSVAVLIGAFGWSLGTVLTKEMILPRSDVMRAGTQMLVGGMMLLATSILIGEIPPFPHVDVTAAAAIAYLIVAGSLVAFTAYQWLLTRTASTAVTSYAYVNPVVALAIGYWIGGEALTSRTLVGSALVLVAVASLLRSARTAPLSSSSA